MTMDIQREAGESLQRLNAPPHECEWKSLAGELLDIAVRSHGHDLRLPCLDCELIAKARAAGL